MWNRDVVGFRLDEPTYSVFVLDWHGEPFELSTDVVVHLYGRRWSATFMTPEMVRECLARWSVTGEAAPGNYSWVPDGIYVSDLTLACIRDVVGDHVEADGNMRAPFQLLEELEPGAP